jgi:exopolysaccharide biosynthesis protein
MSTDRQEPRKPRRALRRVLLSIGAVFALILGIAGWALNRYVIDHVKIADVAAYEAKLAATSTIPTTAGRNATVTTAAGASTVSGSAAARTATSVGANAGTTADAGATATGATATGASSATTASRSATTPGSPTTTAGAKAAQGTPGVTVKKVVTGTGNDTITYFVADVVLGDATELRTGFAENKFGDNIIANTSTIAQANNATFAINGDYYGYRRSGIVIRNGVVYRDVPARQGLALYRDGTMRLYDEKATTAAELLAAGVWNTLSFGPGLLNDGQIPAGIDKVEVDTNVGNHPIQGQQPRTGLGMISANHLVFVAADGRSTGYSRGVTMPEFAAIFQGLGATVAYNLDGGGSTTMYFNGAVVNNPLGKGHERGTSDILYIGPAK